MNIYTKPKKAVNPFGYAINYLTGALESTLLIDWCLISQQRRENMPKINFWAVNSNYLFLRVIYSSLRIASLNAYQTRSCKAYIKI